MKTEIQKLITVSTNEDTCEVVVNGVRVHPVLAEGPMRTTLLREAEHATIDLLLNMGYNVYPKNVGRVIYCDPEIDNAIGEKKMQPLYDI